MTRVTATKAAACKPGVAVRTQAAEHRAVVDAIRDAAHAGFSNDLGRAADVRDISAQLEVVRTDLNAEVPPKPEKPTYVKPEYGGARSISGRCRGTYEGDQGIVLVARGEYYVVKGADPCSTPYVHGYIEETNETVTLNIGREGREAIVVNLRDRETYLDDKQAYRDEVEQSREEYKRSLREFPQRVREWEQEVAAIDRKRGDAGRRRDELERAWHTSLGCPTSSLASDAGHGKASPPAGLK